jgi:2-phospho-L-lactate guanylyltransferase
MEVMRLSQAPTSAMAVHAIVAVKNLGQAKRRLAPAVGQPQRATLVLAMLEDTLTAVIGAPGIASVTVVTPDSDVATTAHRCGARVLAERKASPPPGKADGDGPDFFRSAPANGDSAQPGQGTVRLAPADPATGLNAALSWAADQVRAGHERAGVLALQADLPALRTADITELLTQTPPGRRYLIADHYGTGTAALLQRDPAARLNPRFGPDSAQAHLASGAIWLDGPWPGLRLDVDTAADLDQAVRQGVGTATRRALARIGWPGIG